MNAIILQGSCHGGTELHQLPRWNILPFFVTRIQLKGTLNAWVCHAQDSNAELTACSCTSLKHLLMIHGYVNVRIVTALSAVEFS